MFLNLAVDQQQLVLNMGQLIARTGFSVHNCAEQLALTQNEFVVKLEQGSWSLDELNQLVQLIGPESVENHLDKILLKASEKGPFITAEAFEQEMGWA